MRLALAILCVVAVLGVGTSYLLSPQEIPESSDFELNLGELRTLATSQSGPLPSRVNVAIVAESTKPAAGVLGGMRLDKSVFVWTSFQIVAEDRLLVIDAPPDETVHREGRPSDPFFAEQYDAVQSAMLEADIILVTHEHPDHIGGIAGSPHLSRLSDRLLLTAGQLRNPFAPPSNAPPSDPLHALQPLDYERVHPLVPGVVLVKAPGHTPGSQLVFIRLEDGVELLLVGDVAWHRRQVEEPRGRPLITSWLMGEDSSAVANQLRTLHDLAESSSVLVVTSHDREQLASYTSRGILGSGFEIR